jgi:DNA (cytosine-5)-methyltransferase 1
MEHMVLCAAHYGVPQERWRLFFVGTILKDRPITFPFPTHWAPVRANFTGGRELTWLPAFQNGQCNGHSAGLFHDDLKAFIPVRDAIDDLPPLAVLEGADEMPYQQSPKSAYQCQLRRGSKILYNHAAGALSKQNLERLQHIQPGGSWRDIPHALLPKGMKRARRSDHTRRYGRVDPNGLSGTVLTKCDPHWGSFFHYEQDRAITPREAARIQSFPDKFRFLGSRVSQYVQVGNAVPPLFAETLAKHIRETLLDE